MALDGLSKSFFWSIIHQFSNQIINLIITIILARILVPEQMGLIALTYIFYIIGERVSEAGLGHSLIRAQNIDNQDYNTVFISNVVFSLSFYVILFFLSPFIAKFYDKPLENLIRINSFSIVLLSLGSIQITKLTKEAQFKILAIISTISTLIGGFFGILFALKGFGVYSLVINLFINIICRNILVWHYSSWKPRLEFSKIKFKYHFTFGYKIAIANIIDAIFGNLYTMIIGRRFTLSTVGYYSRADSIKNVTISNIFISLLRVLYPYFSEKQQAENLDDLIKKSMGIMFYLTTPLLLFMAVLAQPLFEFLFSTKWVSSAPFFQLICFAAILYPLEAFNSDILKVKDRSDLILKTETIKKVIIVIALFFAFKYNIYILLYTQICLSIVSFFVNALFTNTVFKISIFDQLKIIIPISIIALISAASVYLTTYFTQNTFAFIQLSVGFFVGILVYYILSIVFKFSTVQLINNLIINKMKKNKINF